MHINNDHAKIRMPSRYVDMSPSEMEYCTGGEKDIGKGWEYAGLAVFGAVFLCISSKMVMFHAEFVVENSKWNGVFACAFGLHAAGFLSLTAVCGYKAYYSFTGSKGLYDND